MIFRWWHNNDDGGGGVPLEYHYVGELDFRENRLSDDKIWEIGQTKVPTEREIELMVGEIIRARCEARHVRNVCFKRDDMGHYINSTWVRWHMEDMLGHEDTVLCQELPFQRVPPVEPTNEFSVVDVENSPAQNA